MGGARRYGWSGFTNTGEYVKSLPSTFRLFGQRAAYVRDGEVQKADKEAAGSGMAQVLNWFSVAMLGTGMIVGAGVFVSSGVAARDQAGPAVVISFMVAGLSALLSALCYSEFAVQYPFAGGAYNYISLTLGELAAWLVVTTLVLQYILANAAVSRSFSAYFAALIGKDPGFFTFPYGEYSVDFLAAGLMVACCLLLMFTTAGGSLFNTIVTGTQLVVILLILILGFWKGNRANLSPFLPYGVPGIFHGASFVFFSFIGFDCVSTLAEEVKNPAKDMPIGIVGCISFVGVIYTLMSLCLVMMVPYNELNPNASFATAFTQVGLPWGQYLVALGAVLGIVTGVLVGVMGVARIVCSMARTHLFFPWFGKISERFQTPMWATVFVTVAGVPLALLTDLPPLIDMVSAGTLMVFAIVALALIWKRVVKPNAPLKENAKPMALIFLLVGVCVAFACIYGLLADDGTSLIIGLAVCAGLTLAFSAAIHLTCTQHDRPSYRVPLFPYIPAASLLLNCFLMASLPSRAYWQLGVFLALMLVFYLLYSVHAGNRFDQEVQAGTATLGTKAVDIEGGAPVPGDDSAAGKDAGLGGAHPPGPAPSGSSFNRSSSLIDRINSGARTSTVLGRRSGGVAHLPPPTL